MLQFLLLGLAIGYISQLITSESLSAYGDESDPQFLEETRKDRVKIWAEASMALFGLIMAPVIVGIGLKWKIFAEILFLIEPMSFCFLSKRTKSKKVWAVYGVIFLFSLVYTYRTDAFFMGIPLLIFIGTVVYSMSDEPLFSCPADELCEDTDEEGASKQEYTDTFSEKDKKDAEMVISLVLFCLLALSLVAFITMTAKIF